MRFELGPLETWCSYIMSWT